MKIGVLIPYRNDRPRFMDNLKRMLLRQTVQPDIIRLVDEPAVSNEKDITYRYRLGYDSLRNKGLDCILFMEVDDWYSPNYIETMLAAWNDHDRPDLLGTSYTYYYHIKNFAYYNMEHYSRSSAMSTLIKPDLDFPWCPDSEVYTDIHLWETLKGQLKGIIFTPEKHICLGIKHGVGLTGGMSHTCRLHRYTNEDKNLSFLKSICDPESFEFYSKYFENEPT